MNSQMLEGMESSRRPEPVSRDTVIARPPCAWQRFAMRRVLGMLSRMRGPGIRLNVPDGRQVICGDETQAPALCIRDYRFFTRVLTGGHVGFGESYVHGDIECDTLTEILSRFVRQSENINDSRSLLSRALRLGNRLLHLTRRNTRRQSRHNIHAHYDLSNDFFKTWLDPTMTYSAALYPSMDASLESAQRNKLNALIDLARIGEQHHVLEIGTGWGSFAIQAASRVGCRVTTVTISEEQFVMARKRVHEAALDHLVDVQLRDYRELKGSFDRIVSVEMIEAVGHRYLPTFFAACDRLLKRDGLLVMQAITIPDHRYDAYRRGCDWIQKHIFPGGHLPSLGALNTAMQRQTTFYVEHLRNVGLHYARTLRDWHERFNQQETALKALGFDDTFMRKWRYYLSYCEAGFASGSLNTLHLVISRPQNATLIDSPTNPHRRPCEHETFAVADWVDAAASVTKARTSDAARRRL